MSTPQTPQIDASQLDPALAAQVARESATASVEQAALTSEALEDADVCARQVEQQMTDDERFSLIVSLTGPVPSIKVPRDPSILEDAKNVSAGYTLVRRSRS